MPGIGVDLIDLRRITKRLAAKVLSPLEQEEFQLIQQPLVMRQFIGSRFAAKEALFKATQTTYSMREVTVAHHPSGEPYFVEFPDVKLSISHEKDYAIAFVIADNK